MFAVAAGLVAAGGAAALLDIGDGGGGPPSRAIEDSREATYQVADFDEIATIGPQDVVITYGETQSIRAEGSPEALAGLEAVVEDGELRIRPKGIPAIDDWGRFESATFYVTVPRLESVSLRGSGDVSVDRVEGASFSGSVSGSGELSIDALQVDDAKLSVSGSGDLAAAGTARKTRVSIDGSGEVQASDLRSGTAMVTIVGSGDLELTVDDDATVSITGRGNVDITGTANCTVSRSGTGNVRCGGDTDGD